MLTSKQRAYLRGEANQLATILMVGKGGVSDDVVQQAVDALRKRELIKWYRSSAPSLFSIRQIQKNRFTPCQRHNHGQTGHFWWNV